MTLYKVTLQTLSPVHIGDGDELRRDFDFVVHNNQTYRLDEDAILLAKEALLKPNAAGVYPPPGKLLDKEDFNRRELFRYILRGAVGSEKTDARLRSFIKDAHDRVYIPGSSLKGALRTALAWTGWEEINPPLERKSIGSRKSWAAQPLEKKLFGPDPNHDLLRALKISDLFGPQKPGEGLVIVNARVLTLRSQQSPIEMEALPGDISFIGSLTVDEALFAPWAEGKLGFGARRRWLDELPARAQSHSHARIQALAEWFEKADNTEKIARFYRDLLAATLPHNQALIQLGWGSGWDGKTFWTRLQKDARLFEQLVHEFRMHRAAKGSPPRKPGDPFPRSRRAAVLAREGFMQPVAPFGWVLLTLEQV